MPMIARTPLLTRVILLGTLLLRGTACGGDPSLTELAQGFGAPPDSARPGVYWYFMDGNQTRDGMAADLLAMHQAGLRKALYLEVDLGMPRGPVPFMSEQWQENFAYAVKEADRLGMEIILGTGPGWAGAGGPWIEPAQAMQHLTASSVQATGPGRFADLLPVPAPRPPTPFAGLSPELAKRRDSWFADVAVLAFPTPAPTDPPDLLDVKALYDTQPYSSWKHVPRFVPSYPDYPLAPAGSTIDPTKVLDLTNKLQPDGHVDWEMPAGKWTVMRFVARCSGSTTRPAPAAGHGFETDRFRAEAFDWQFQQFHQKLLDKIGPQRPGRGWTCLHLDSWESSCQNWSSNFRAEFSKRRGYDPQPFFPAYAGLLVGSREQTERFLWDLRKTAQELLIANHGSAIKRKAHEHGMVYSNEPYDMNPAGDLDLGSVADIPMCEFWSGDLDSVYSCVEAPAIAHTMGRPVVRAEAFTTPPGRGYQHNPADLKNQTDWAFAIGINDLIFHTFQHQPLGLDGPKPGMAMGPFGVQWQRNQTFWPMVGPYHDYIARCGYLLRQGVDVQDILYLTQEGAPHIFLPPADAMTDHGLLREKKEYGFDAVTGTILLERARAEDGKIAFPGGTSYEVLVLPNCETMTPELLLKLERLVRDGITMIGAPPRKSPSLVGFPECDKKVAAIAQQLWGTMKVPAQVSERRYGKGRIIWGGDATPNATGQDAPIYQNGRWIWSPDDGAMAQTAAGVTRYFQRVIRLDRPLRAAQLAVTADNDYEVWLNGKPLTKGNDFHVVNTMDITPALRPRDNMLAVAVTNTGEAPNPAGLIACVKLEYADGQVEVLGSNESWRVGAKPNKDWQTAPQPAWPAAKVLGPAAMSPWILRAGPKVQTDYPSYASTTAWLRQSGIAPAFQSTGPLRYHQRRSQHADIFFVSNREATAVTANCIFRSDGSAPELWDPITGQRSALSVKPAAKPGHEPLLELPLQFAPYQSWLVIFQRGGNTAQPAAKLTTAPDPKNGFELTGPWELQFQPKWGGPEEPLTFDQLIPWNTHALERIRYYSGEAVYRKTFNAPAAISANTRTFLDLGVVHKLARVKLNGHDLGIVWTPPFQVETTGHLQSNNNTLEITVVNTWVNRLIGDQQPANMNVSQLKWPSGLLGGQSFPAGRYTFTTVNDYNANSPLQTSGLLGPVSLRW